MENPKEETSGLLLGHFTHAGVSAEGSVNLDLWLEEDGFFRISFRQSSEKGSSSNEEKGIYVRSSENKYTLTAVERQWSWKEGSEGDSGTDATDLKYPVTLKGNDLLTLVYLDTNYECKRQTQ